MKARLLKRLLNDTGYIIADHGKYIAAGSPMCHNLIAVDKESLKVTFALDTFDKGRESIDNDELVMIWDTLHELIGSGQIQEVLNGQDEVDNPLPVYTSENGELIESFTDEYGWPNTTLDGQLMYDNTYFKTKGEAVEYGICDISAELASGLERVEKWSGELQAAMAHNNVLAGYMNKLRVLKAAQQATAQNLDDKGRCCGRKPLVYKRDKKKFCDRCNRAYDITTGKQIENWAWTQTDDVAGFVARKVAS